jgi:hypothetical protein
MTRAANLHLVCTARLPWNAQHVSSGAVLQYERVVMDRKVVDRPDGTARFAVTLLCRLSLQPGEMLQFLVRSWLSNYLRCDEQRKTALFVLEARDQLDSIFEGTVVPCVVSATITAGDFGVALIALFDFDYGGLDVLHHALIDIGVDANLWRYFTLCSHRVFESIGYAGDDSLALCRMKYDNIATLLK